MLVEHTFVTTLDAEPALTASHEVTTLLGFLPVPDSAQGRQTCEWVRGMSKVKYYIRISDLPQRIRLDFDRGRVTLAVYVQERGREKPQLHEDMLVTIARAIEARLSGKTTEEALAVTAAPHAAIEKHFRRQRIIKRCLIAFLIVFVAAVLGLCVVPVAIA